MRQPDWNTAPEWARFWAMDEDGGAWWYSDEPVIDEELGGWDMQSDVHDATEAESDHEPEWRESLRGRPQ